ncbi:hypothetical protein [Streptomyces sp. I05A-00742]|uniref:hypothetical protein n=1 Tax=Streptomyces sp. I05A-00742 TaxID=2732853 RepID=UPI0020175021|nr:hypothetical protein [Streptomyces sp. I05A-00742]
MPRTSSGICWGLLGFGADRPLGPDWLYRGSRRTRLHPSGAHSDFLRPESAHLLLTLAERSR